MSEIIAVKVEYTESASETSKYLKELYDYLNDVDLPAKDYERFLTELKDNISRIENETLPDKLDEKTEKIKDLIHRINRQLQRE